MDTVITIAFLIFDNFTALDVIGPYEILSKIPDSEVCFVGLEAKNYTDGKGFSIKAGYSIENIKSPDILVIPGGQGTDSLLTDKRILEWIKNAHETSKWTASVCSGALLLASSGLLKNKTATTHWNRKEQLKQYGVKVVNERYHKDGKIITSAGVSAGIDMALYLLSLVTNENYAKAVQLGIEYDPSPPFDCGSPEKAPKELLEMVKKKTNKRDTDFSCVNKSPKPLSDSDREKTEKEIKEIIDTLIMNFEALNTDEAFKVYYDSPNFSMIASDGSRLDYKTFLKCNKEYLEACSDFKLTTIKDEIKILSSDLVVFSWIYKAEATLKTGVKNIWDKAGASFLFKKIDDNWKVIYYHESSLPPATK